MALTAAPMMTLVAATSPAFCPPDKWFDDPTFGEPTGLKVTPDGQVFGHIATFGVCHIGIDHECVEAPKSFCDYAYFKKGSVETEAGDRQTGVLTINTGHADLSLDFADTVSHYDHTGTAVADVNIGEDAIGIWVAGAIREGVTDEHRRILKASGAISGDWRNVGGHLELVAGLAVNTPGFPVPATALAASAARPTALVAASIVRADDGISDIADAVVKALDERESRRTKLDRLSILGQERKAARLEAVLASVK